MIKRHNRFIKAFTIILIVFMQISCNREEIRIEGENIKYEVINSRIDKHFIKTPTGENVNKLPKEVFNKIILDLENDGKKNIAENLKIKYSIIDGNAELKSNFIRSNNRVGSSSPITFTYTAHIQNKDWVNWANLGYMVGTTGQHLRLEALQFSSSMYFPLKARGHVENKGWLPYVGLNEVVGTTGQHLRLEAIQIDIPKSYATDVYYQVHVQNLGWMPLVRNNEIAGTVGKHLRIEAFRMYMYIIA